ncbi:MAG: hypothetical protein GX247_00550 [Mollicutes bacterium]|nr:hypothetical protein [Mollicutes bacterium]
MKKYYLFLFLFFFLISNVKAETYYSPYTDFSEWTTTYVKEDDITIVEGERRYKWYKEGKILGDYYIEGENNPNFPLIDYEDFIVTSFSEWSKTKPEEKLNRLINERTLYEYQDMKEVRYIHLSNLQGSYGSLRISEIEVYVDNNKISYSYYCEGCNSDFKDHINNGKTIENMSYINNNGYLRIDLNNYYSIDRINLKLYLFDVGTTTKKYDIKITREKNLNSTSYLEKKVSLNFSCEKLSEIIPFTYNYLNMNITNLEWYEKKESLDYIESTPTRKVNPIKEYQYQDKLYRYYKLEKEYSNDYYKEEPVNYPKKDENMYQDYYRYKKRDKVVIQDELLITDYDITLWDFIISSTTNNIQIESNLDINKNGVYKVKYILPFETIIKNVEVNIPDNNLDNQLDKLNQEIKNLKEDNLNLLETIKIKDQKIKELENNNQVNKQTNKKNKTSLQEYQDKTNNQNNKLEEILNKNQLLENDNMKLSTKKSSFIDNDMVLTSLFIFLICYLIILIIKKKKSI